MFPWLPGKRALPFAEMGKRMRRKELVGQGAIRSLAGDTLGLRVLSDIPRDTVRRPQGGEIHRSGERTDLDTDLLSSSHERYFKP